jgi:hypothetical protein
VLLPIYARPPPCTPAPGQAIASARQSQQVSGGRRPKRISGDQGAPLRHTRREAGRHAHRLNSTTSEARRCTAESWRVG